jgi:hypothetical protein
LNLPSRNQEKSLKKTQTFWIFPVDTEECFGFLKKHSPRTHIYGGDIDQHALNFCKKEFNIIPVPSDIDFKKVKFPVSYDLIWVGSLFTHIDSKDFRDLLEKLISSLKEKEIIIFTTHGKECLNQLGSYGLGPIEPSSIKMELENTGFVFQPYPGQSNYGISITVRPYVIETVNQISEDKVKLIFHKNRGWDHHQDVYAFQKNSNPEK